MKRTRSAWGVLLALGLALGWAPAAWSSTITSPAGTTQIRGNVGTPIAPVNVEGTGLASLKASPSLPEGLELKAASVGEKESRWVISGTPKVTLPTTPITLEAESESKKATVTVDITIHNALPTISASPGNQVGTVGTAIAPVTIDGKGLAFFEESGLPAGLHLEPVAGSEEEWTVTGIPTAAQAAQPVKLTPENSEHESGEPITFEWTIHQKGPMIEAPAEQVSTAGTAIVPVVVNGTNLAHLEAPGLPAGLVLTKQTEAEWTITGTPTTPQDATVVTLEAKNAEEVAGQSVTFKWTVDSAPAPAPGPAETPSKPVETPKPTLPTVISAGRLGTMPTQKPGARLVASFLCEVAACRVEIAVLLTAGHTKFHARSAAVTIRQGHKVKIPVELTKKQRALIAAALKKHKKVTAAISATIQSTVGAQVTRALTVTVKH